MKRIHWKNMEIKLYEKSIVLGGATTLFFNRKPEDRDIEAIKRIHALGEDHRSEVIKKKTDELKLLTEPRQFQITNKRRRHL